MWVVASLAGATVSVSVPDSIVAAPGETFTLPITVTAVSGVLGYYFELGYSTDFEVINAQNGLLTASWPAPILNSSAGRCSVASYSTVPIAGAGSLVQIQFRVKSTALLGAVSTVFFRKVELNDGAIVATAQNGTVTVADIAVLGMPVSLDLLPGDEFTLPIELRDAGGVLGLVFSLSYAPNLLDFLGTTPGALPAGWGAPTVNAAINGRITVGAYSTQPFSGSATVIYLRFRVREDAPLDETTYIEIFSAELNDGALPVVYESMLVRIVREHPMPLGPPVWIILAVLLICMSLRNFRHSRNLSSIARRAGEDDRTVCNE